MSIAGSLNPCVGGADLSYGRGVVTHRFSTLFSIVSMKENEKTHFKMVDWSGAIVTPRGFSGSSDATWTLAEQISISRLARMSLSADDIVFSTSTSFNNIYLGKLNDR